MIRDLETKFSALNPWFDDLTYEWSDLLPIGTHITYRKNQIIFHQNQQGDYVYLVLTGRIRLYLLSPNGEEKALAIIGKNGIIGECALNEASMYATSAITASDVELIRIDKNIFNDQLVTNPVYARQILDMISRKYRLLCSQSLQLSYTKSLPRLCATFVHLTIKYGEHMEGPMYKLTINFTHQEMANLLGITRVTIAKHFKWLEDEGYIWKDGRHYIIGDLDELAELADEELMLD